MQGVKYFLLIRIKQNFNSKFVFSKIGYIYLFLELVGFIGFIILLVKGVLHAQNINFIALASFIITLTNSYLTAEKYLFSGETKLDIKMCVSHLQIVLVDSIQIFLSNMKTVVIFPILLIITSKENNIETAILMCLAMLIIAPFVMVTLNILINRFLIVLKPAIYLIVSLLWSAIILATILYATPDIKFLKVIKTGESQVMLFFLIVFFFFTLIILRIPQIVRLWSDVYLDSSFERRGKTIGGEFYQYCKYTNNPVIAKEWTLLCRNPVMKVRFIIWIAAVISLMYGILKMQMQTPEMYSGIAVALWLICYGELPATAWQNEGECRWFYWLSGVNKYKLFLEKLIVYLFFILLTIVAMIVIGISNDVSSNVIICETIKVAMLLSAVTLVILLISSKDFSKPKIKIDNIIFEQVPLQLGSITAICIGIALIIIYFGFIV